MASAEDYKDALEKAWKKTVQFYRKHKIKLNKEEDLRCLLYHFCIQELEKLNSLDLHADVPLYAVGGYVDLNLGDDVIIELKYWRSGKSLEDALAEYHHDLTRLLKAVPDYKYAYFLAIDETGGALSHHSGQKRIGDSKVFTKIYSVSEKEIVPIEVPSKFKGTEAEKPYIVLAKALTSLGIDSSIGLGKNRPSGEPACVVTYFDESIIKKHGIEWLELDWKTEKDKIILLACYYKKNLPKGFKHALAGEGYDRWYADYWWNDKPHKLSKSSKTHVLIDEMSTYQLSVDRIAESIKKLSKIITDKGLKISTD